MTTSMELIYLAAAVIFIIGLKWMASPVRARKGNMLSAIGMLVAVAVTLLDRGMITYQLFLIGILVGSVLGVWMARTVPMTSMPQMVGILNGFGGGASALVAAAEWYRLTQPGMTMDASTRVSIYASTLIGGVTFMGSAIAAGKLQEIISGRPILFKGQHALNILLLVGALALGSWLTYDAHNLWPFVALNLIALSLGVTLVIPIGGADMPVVITLLNSYSGLAAAMTGFVIQNDGLIITGALVGASGIILTQIMCKAMNRSLANVLFGGLGAPVIASERDKLIAARGVRTITAEDTAALLCYSRSVMIVPGYGLAVAQAQHQVQELASMLEKRGVQVHYAIHPVAGRMPGHMNVLLAEANVPYPLLMDQETANPELERTDVALVIGANDVVNPAAHNNPQSPIYGMPILDVDRAGQAIVMKRSMNPGFAGIENELFYGQKTSMLFGDAKKSLTALINEVRTTE